MAILVDQARWPWRGTTWCHLVSDEHLDELHEFAAGLGCRRIGFQGDHYDIDVVTRSLALELGAEACDSRELVRRLRGAGLRLRPSAFEKWSLHARFDGGFAVQRNGARALVLVGTGDRPSIIEDPARGIHHRVDQLGEWSVEIVHPPLEAHQ
ncbi:MAG: DUF4031 domain-containing protein [Acidimicrobiales bacterium]